MHRSPLTEIIIILVYVLLGFHILGPLVGFFVALPFYDGSMTDFIEAIKSPYGNESMRTPLLLMQGAATLTGLIGIPILYLRGRNQFLSPLFAPPISISNLLLIPFIVISFLPTIAPIIQWNADLNLPEALSGIESQLQKLEQSFAKATEFLTKFNSPGMFILALVVVAILPAFGEELVFRGILQPRLINLTNPHAGIWITAFLFAAMHLQFYGLVPRMLLGAMFGYLYLWSGNLIVPMLAHFINNAFSLLMIYLYQLGKTKLNPETDPAMPPYAIMVAVLIFILLILLFRRQTKSMIRDL